MRSADKMMTEHCIRYFKLFYHANRALYCECDLRSFHFQFQIGSSLQSCWKTNIVWQPFKITFTCISKSTLWLQCSGICTTGANVWICRARYWFVWNVEHSAWGILMQVGHFFQQQKWHLHKDDLSMSGMLLWVKCSFLKGYCSTGRD